MRRDEEVALREQKASLLKELRDRDAASRQGTGTEAGDKSAWTAEDQAAFDKLVGSIEEIDGQLERAFRVRQLSSFNPVPDADLNGAPKTFSEFRIAGEAGQPWDLPEVRLATFKYWIEGRESLTADELRVLSKATGAAGAYLVPTDFYNQVIRATRFIGAIGDAATVITTASGDSIQVPQNLAHGTAAWIAESGSYTPSDETFAQATMNAYKAGSKIIISEELLQDSAFPLDSFLATEFGERIRALVEDAYVNGNGTGKPLGILDAGSGVTTYTFPTGQVAASTYAALVGALFQIPVQYRENMGIWVSDGFAQRLYLLADSQGRPLWNVNVAAGGPDTFLGFPIYTNPALAAPGASTKSMIVGDMRRGYMIRRVDGFSMQRQNELHSDNGQVGFRGYLRLDGKPILPDALRVVAFAAT